MPLPLGPELRRIPSATPRIIAAGVLAPRCMVWLRLAASWALAALWLAIARILAEAELAGRATLRLVAFVWPVPRAVAVQER